MSITVFQAWLEGMKADLKAVETNHELNVPVAREMLSRMVRQANLGWAIIREDANRANSRMVVSPFAGNIPIDFGTRVIEDVVPQDAWWFETNPKRFHRFAELFGRLVRQDEVKNPGSDRFKSMFTRAARVFNLTKSKISSIWKKSHPKGRSSDYAFYAAIVALADSYRFVVAGPLFIDVGDDAELKEATFKTNPSQLLAMIEEQLLKEKFNVGQMRDELI